MKPLLLPGEAVHDSRGMLLFWPTLFRYWLRFAPFWIGFACGVGVMLVARYLP